MKNKILIDKFLYSENLTLSCKNVNFFYNNVQILANLSFSCKTGEIIAFCGKNGSGKSTFFKILCGITKNPCKNSSVFLINSDSEKLNLKDLTQFEKAKFISFLPQNENPFWNIDSFSFILQGRFCRSKNFYSKKDYEKVYEIAENLNIFDLLKKNIFELSGGEFQKVKIARSLVQETKFLILDEPTSNIDIVFESEFIQFLRDLCRQKNIAILFSIHNLNIASRFADKIVFLSKNQDLIFGKPEEVITTENVYKTFGKKLEITKHPIYGNLIVN